MKYFERAELGRPGFNQCAMSDRRKPYRRFAWMQRGSSKSGCTKARLERIPKDPGQGEQCEGREIPGLTLEGAVLDIRINQATQIAPVILSGAPQRFVSYQDHWRGVEGPRECVIYHTMSGSSHEIAIAPRCGRGVKNLIATSLGDRMRGCSLRSKASAFALLLIFGSLLTVIPQSHSTSPTNQVSTT